MASSPLPDGLLDRIAALSLKQLKQVIDTAGYDRSGAVEKDDLRVLACQAHTVGGVPLPNIVVPPPLPPAVPDLSDPKNDASVRSEDSDDEEGSPNPRAAVAMPPPIPEADEKTEILQHWTERALRLQLELCLGEPAPASSDKAALVAAYWDFLTREGTALGSEYERRWLRAEALLPDDQARIYVEAVTGKPLPSHAQTLADGLRSGEALCDLVSVFLVATGRAAVTPTRGLDTPVTDAINITQAQASRLVAKQTENLALFTAACSTLGVPRPSLLDAADLIEGKNDASVARCIVGLALTAQRIVDYRGPQMGPVQRKEKTWQQRASIVAHDWRMPGGVAPPSHLSRGASSMASALGSVSSKKLVTDSDDPAAWAAEALASVTGDAEAEVAADPEGWRDRYTFVSVDGLPEEEAALVWIDAVLAKAAALREQPQPPPLPRPLQAALKSGAALCRLMHAIAPGLIKEKQLLESTKPFEQMAQIDAYLQGCNRLGVTRQKFVTVDLSDGRDLRAVARQIWALALVVRSHPELTTFRGPFLGNKGEVKAAAEAMELREGIARRQAAAAKAAAKKEAKRMEAARKRIERDIQSEEIEAERQLIERLRREEDLAIESKKQAIADARAHAADEQEKRASAELASHCLSGWLYKRGGVAKLWRKRWFAIDESGLLQYFTTPEDMKAGQAALGVLVLANASVRRPTDVKSKGKFQSTCMRLDLDPDAQISSALRKVASTRTLRGQSKLGASDDEDDGIGLTETSSAKLPTKKMGSGFFGALSSKSGGSEAAGADDVSSAASKDKYKYLLAAESAGGMQSWMASLDWWSAKEGNDARRSVIALGVTEEEAAMLRKSAKVIPGVNTQYVDRTGAPPEYAEEESEEEEDEDEALARAAQG